MDVDFLSILAEKLLEDEHFKEILDNLKEERIKKEVIKNLNVVCADTSSDREKIDAFHEVLKYVFEVDTLKMHVWEQYLKIRPKEERINVLEELPKLVDGINEKSNLNLKIVNVENGTITLSLKDEEGILKKAKDNFVKFHL